MKHASKRFQSLDALRGVAALLVILNHSVFRWVTPHWMMAIGTLGNLSVPVFFCLSGFVLQYGYANRKIEPGAFLWHRIARIYPLSLLGMVAAYAAYHLTGDTLAGVPGAKYSLITSGLLIQAWWSDMPVRAAWDSVSWTLSCEMFYYLLSPVTIPFIARLKGSTAAKAIYLILLVRLALTISGFEQNHLYLCIKSPIGGFANYMCGALAAQVLAVRPVCLRRWSLSAIISLGIVIPLVIVDTSFSHVQLMTFELIPVPGFILLIIAAASKDLNGSSADHFFRGDLMQFLGKISFSVYLVHPFVIGAAAYCFCRIGLAISSPSFGGVFTLFCMMVVVAISAVTYFWFELPAQRFLLKISPRSINFDAPVPSRR